jgi:hypothetical protein
MFNNKFLKHDPLLEAVKGARAEGDLRRKAEALVNEEFGVYSRKAVVREELAAYDARLEEAYKCMKEGDVENIMNPNSNWAKKQAADKSNPFNEPTPDPTKVAPNIMMKGAGGDGTRSMVDKVKSLFKEGKKLADKDYDKDGKVESPKDEVWGSRLRAAKMAGKLKEGKKWEEEVDYSAQDRAPVTKSAPKEDPSLPKEYPGAASSAPTAQRLSNAKAAVTPIKEEEQIDELKQSTIRSYIDKAHARATAAKSAGFKKDWSEKKGKKAAGARAEFSKRTSGLGMAGKKLAEEENIEEGRTTGNRSYKGSPDRKRKAVQMALGRKHKDHPDWNERTSPQYSALKLGRQLQKQGIKEEEQIDEISKELAGKYIKHADYKRSESSFQSGKVYGKELATKKRTKQDVETARKHNRDSYKREKGVNMAVNKLTGRAKVQANEAMMESIVSKLAAKHMKEDQSFNSARVTESNKLGLGKTVREQAVDMAPPPAIYGQQVPGQSVKQAPRPVRTTYSQGASQTPMNVKPNVSTSSRFSVQQGMSSAGKQAATTRASTLGGMNVADKIGSVAPRASSVAGTIARAAVRAAPAIGAAAEVMRPKPANAGENEFARQARYKTPGSTNISKQPAPTTGPSASAAEKVGISQKMPSIGPKLDNSPVKQSFSQAYRAAREAGGSKAQFTWNDKTFQAAAKKSEYVAPEKQVKVNQPSTSPTPTADDVKKQFGSSQDLAKDIASKAAPAPAAKQAEPPRITGSAPIVQADKFEKPAKK